MKSKAPHIFTKSGLMVGLGEQRIGGRTLVVAIAVAVAVTRVAVAIAGIAVAVTELVGRWIVAGVLVGRLRLATGRDQGQCRDDEDECGATRAVHGPR